MGADGVLIPKKFTGSVTEICAGTGTYTGWRAKPQNLTQAASGKQAAGDVKFPVVGTQHHYYLQKEYITTFRKRGGEDNISRFSLHLEF